MLDFRGRGMLLDIEGTTSSVRFVVDVLFPYARQRLDEYLRTHYTSPEVVAACEHVAHDAGQASLADWTAGLSVEEARRRIVAELERLMEGDVKATGLKQVQGLIWREGYERGELVSHVYADVPPVLDAWRRAGLDVRIFSSGSVTAQLQFFAHTEHGNLLPYFRGHYDTTIGSKREAASYARIVAAFDLAPAEVLFASDIVAELDAARAAGLQTALVVRPDNAPTPPGHGHPLIATLAEIVLA